MIKKVLTPFLLASVLCSYGQQAKNGENHINKVTVTQCSSFAISKPLSELPDLPSDHTMIEVPRYRTGKSRFKEQEVGLPNGVDPVLQNIQGTRNAVPPIVNFDGIDDVAFPPDPSGAAGKDYYIQAVNVKYQIFDKTGKSVKGPFNLSSLWSGSKDSGDPIVLYDEFAERWFISQFQTGTDEILVAISETGDPLGKYYTYKFKCDDFPDYFKVSIWPDAYYVTANTGGQNALAFERDKMLAGDESAKMVGVKFTPGTHGFTSPLPADADGELPPLGTPNYIFSFKDDGWGSASKDEIIIHKMIVDWDNPNSTKVELHQSLETEPFDTKFGKGTSNDWDNIAQKGSSQKLDAVLYVFNYRAQYRRWVEYNTVTLAHTVDVDGSDHGGIRWYELRDDGNGQFKIYQQGTYAPDTHSRFIPSISMDKYGNIGLAYNVCSKDMYAGLRYTGRKKDDELGKMTIEEEVGVEGTGAQSGGNRFGDYSQLTVDPDGTTFWFTGEYLGSGGSRKTRVFSFKIDDGTTGVNDNKVDGIGINVHQKNGQLNVSVTNLKDNKELVVDLFTMRGELIETNKTIPTNKSFAHTFDVSKLAKGTYLVRFGNRSFQEVSKVAIK